MHDSKHDTRFDSSGAFSPKKRASPGTGSWGCFLRRPRLSFSSSYHYLPLLCSYNIIYNNGFHLRCFRICCVVPHVRVLTGISTLLRVHLNIFIGSLANVTAKASCTRSPLGQGERNVQCFGLVF